MSAPKAQRLYVNVTSGEVGTFDSWAKGRYLGFYKLSSGAFVRMQSVQMREAIPGERVIFARAKRSGIECVIASRTAITK